MNAARHLWLVSLLLAACQHLPPDLVAERFPVFQSAVVCARDHGPFSGIPDDLALDRDCVAIDPVRLRRLLLAASPADEAGWKGGVLVVGRSQEGGDRYFYVSFYGGFFVPVGVRGIYVVPRELRKQWEDLVLQPIRVRATQRLHERNPSNSSR